MGALLALAAARYARGLLDAARRRGIPVAPPSELPAGLTPWGPARRWYEHLRPWQQGLLMLACAAMFMVALYAALVAYCS